MRPQDRCPAHQNQYNRRHSARLILYDNLKGMSNAIQPVALEEFLARQERSNGQREELIEGEIVLSPEPKPLHAEIIRRLREALMPLEKQGLLIQQGFGIILPPNSVPGPELAAIDRERWQKALPGGCLPHWRAKIGD
jgi:Uma2 family endonuclease